MREFVWRWPATFRKQWPACRNTTCVLGDRATEGKGRQAYLDSHLDPEPDDRVDRPEDTGGRREPAIEEFEHHRTAR